MRDRHRTTTTITTAAHLLGVSVETLRKRLQRGSVDGFKAEDGTWRVVLDMPAAELLGKGEPVADPTDSAVLDDLLGEVRHLRGQVAMLAEALRDLAVILQEMHGRIMSTPAPRGSAEAEDLDWPMKPDKPDEATDAGEPILTPAQTRRLLMAVLEVVERQRRPSDQG